MKIGDKFVRDMTDEELAAARAEVSKRLNIDSANILTAINQQNATTAMVNIIIFEQDRRKNTIQIAGSLPNGRLIVQ